MCGIVGYVGNNKATKFLIEGLSKLEYRGYDSAGVAVIQNGNVEIVKQKGRLANLGDALNTNPLEGTIGIGHTRWATHGEPSDVNSHPHQTSKGDITVVHNGIIENYLELTNFLKEQGYEFKSATDTEVIPNLIHYFYEGDLFAAVVKATEKLEGSYAIGAICGQEPDKLVAVRKDSPLIVGLGENETFIASDIPAVLSYTRDVYLLEDKEYVLVTRDGVKVLTATGEEINKEIYKVTWNEDSAEKGGYEDFMLKEIYEQPKAVRDTLAGKIALGKEITLDNVKFTKEELENFDRVYIVACGTAYHAGLVGKTVIEKMAKIPVEVDVASEFRYKEPLITEKTLIIVVSQSGETADTLAVLRDGQRQGARVLAITNVVGSSVSREADDVIYTLAGREIAVASTKAYTTQILCMFLLAIKAGKIRGTLNDEEATKLLCELESIPAKIQEILDGKDVIQKFASQQFNKDKIFYIGRQFDSATSLESALKLKEVSYMHSEAFAAGELKHGPIALIDDKTLVVAIASEPSLYDKIGSNMVEVKARGATVLVSTQDSGDAFKGKADEIFRLPECSSTLASLLTVIPAQLFA